MNQLNLEDLSSSETSRSKPQTSGLTKPTPRVPRRAPAPHLCLVQLRGERRAPPPHVALKNSGGESNRETPPGGGVRRAEKRGGGVKERNSSRCVTEYYITPSLHTHGAHSHTRRTAGTRSRGSAPGGASWSWGGTRSRGVGTPHTPGVGSPIPAPVCSPGGGDNGRASMIPVHTRPCRGLVHTPGSAAPYAVSTQLTPIPKITHVCICTHTHSRAAMSGAQGTTENHRPSVPALECLKPTEPQDLRSSAPGPVILPSACMDPTHSMKQKLLSQCVPRNHGPARGV